MNLPGVFPLEATMNEKLIIVLRKIARIWSGVIIALGVLVFLAELFESQNIELEPYPWWENLMPAALFLAVVGLAVAWKWEEIGGSMTIGFALVNLLLYIATGRDRVWAVVVIMLPVVLPAFLFLTCYWGSTRPTET
jgi:hypothetical protein